MRVLALTPHPDLPEAHLLAGLAAEGVSVRVGCASDAEHREWLANRGVDLVTLETGSRFDPHAIFSIRRWVKEFNPEILHAFTARAISCAVLATVGRSIPIVAYRGTMGNISRLDPSSWFTFLNPKVRRIVCVSRAVQNDLFTIRREREVVVQIYKGHALEWYDQVRPISREEWGIHPEEIVICCAANMRPLKGVDVLVRAFARLPAGVRGKLVLVGEVRDPEITALIAREGIASRVVTTGFRPDALRFTAAADIFVMPSLRREGFPKAVIEAMALARAVVVSRVGGMPEMIDEGRSGFVVAPGDVDGLAHRLLELVADETLRRRLGDAARAAVSERFSVDTTIQRTLEMYRELVR